MVGHDKLVDNLQRKNIVREKKVVRNFHYFCNKLSKFIFRGSTQCLALIPSKKKKPPLYHPNTLKTKNVILNIPPNPEPTQIIPRADPAPTPPSLGRG